MGSALHTLCDREQTRFLPRLQSLKYCTVLEGVSDWAGRFIRGVLQGNTALYWRVYLIGQGASYAVLQGAQRTLTQAAVAEVLPDADVAQLGRDHLTDLQQHSSTLPLHLQSSTHRVHLQNQHRHLGGGTHTAARRVNSPRSTGSHTPSANKNNASNASSLVTTACV